MKHLRTSIPVLFIATAFLLNSPQKPCAGEVITRIPGDVTAKTVDGKTAKMGDYKGKLVFMNVWRTDCGTCLSEIPILNKLQQVYSSNDFTVIGVSMDVKQDKIVEDVIKKKNISYPVWLAYGQPIFKYVNGAPFLGFTIVIGPEGEIIGTIQLILNYQDAVAALNDARAILKKRKALKSP